MDQKFCPTCVTTRTQKRALEYQDGVWKCMTFGGCNGQFTDGYLRHVQPATNRIMVALGMENEEAIERGSRQERLLQNVATGERSVVLPSEDET